MEITGLIIVITLLLVPFVLYILISSIEIDDED